MKIRIVFVFVAIFFLGCASREVAIDAVKIEHAKKVITENCLTNIDYEVLIIDNDTVKIKHKTARARVVYSKANRAGVLMLMLGGTRIEELKSIRECAAPYMEPLLEELFKDKTARKAE